MATQTEYLNLTKQAAGELPDVGILNTNLDTIDSAVGILPKTVNGTSPDTEGNIQITNVATADNLNSSYSQETQGAFIRRTTGGNASVGTGDALLLIVRGTRSRTGYVEEALEWSCSNESLTVDVNRDTFVQAAGASMTLTLTYSGGSWSETPGDYGISVSGSPSNGDTITVDYTKEERGTITQSNPQRFVATGWNLYEAAAGYARVVKYSDTYGYRVIGAYTALQWAATVSGTRSSLTVSSTGLFQVPADGYVFVTGASASSTAIYTTWADMQAAIPDGAFAVYTTSIVDLSSVMSNHFPNGLMQVGSLQDEIDLVNGVATSYVERMSYSTLNRQTAEASGRAYEFDEDYIYIARATAQSWSVSIDGSYSEHQYGMEFFDGTAAPVWAQTRYGTNLKNKLERDVLTKSAQVLSDAEQLQVLNNIGMDVRELSTTLNSAVSAGLVTEYSNVINISNSNTMFRLIKFGRIVMMSGMFYTYTGEQYPLTNELTLVKLAKSVRPIVATYLPLYNSEYRLYGSKGLSINSGTGEMKLRTNTTMDPGTAFRFYGIYISAE